MKTVFSVEWLGQFPAEVCILVVLIMITIYRRRLSSNHEYRGKQTRHKGTKRQPLELSTMISTSSKRIVEEQPRRLYKMILSLPKRISTTIDEQIFLTFDENEDYNNGKNHTRSILTKLTPELIYHVLHFLPTDDIVRMGLTSRKYYSLIISNNMFWEHLWVQTYSYLWNHHAIRKIRQEKQLFWDPLLNYAPPQCGWFYFYLLFENCWIDWLLAGLNTPRCCMVVVRNNWYDVTSFLAEHPGSPETLSEGAGGDGTEMFEDISHSSYARQLMQRFCVCSPAEEYAGLLQRNRVCGGEHWAFSPGQSGRFSSFDSTASSAISLTLALPHEDTSNTRLYTPEKGRSRLKDRLCALQTLLQQLVLSEEADKFFDRAAAKVLPGVRADFFPACENHQHPGSARAVFDPLANEWFVWWTCCATAYPVIRMPKHWATSQSAAYRLLGYEATA